MTSLRGLLVRGPLLVFALVLGVLAAFAGMGLQRFAWRDAETRVEEHLGHVTRQLDFRLAEMERLAESIGESWELGRIDPGKPEACWSQLAPWVRPHAHLTGVNLVRADGEGFGLGRIGPALMGRGIHSDRGGWRFGPVIGDAPAPAPEAGKPEPAGIDFRERPWFREGREASRATWTGAFLFAARREGQPGLSLVRPVKDSGGQLQGVLSLDLVLESLSRLVWDARPTPGTWLMVLDGQGRVIVPPSAPGAQSGPEKSGFLLQGGPGFHPLSHELFAGLKAGGTGTRGFQAARDGYHGQIRALGRSLGPDWHLVLAMPDQDINASPRKRAMVVAATWIALVALFGLLAHHYARRVVRPLTRLALGAEALAAGEAPVLPVTRIQEIRTLADALAAAHRGMSERAALQARLRQGERLEALGTLAGGIAHDLNNQLAAILTQLELGLDKLPADHPSWSNLRRAWDASRRAADTTRSILSFSRTAKPELESLDINQLAEGTLALLGKLIGPGIRIETDLQAAPAVVAGDRAQLEQLLVNLLLNARDALPAGGTIQVWTALDGDAVVLRVRDNGTGMAPEVLSRIFDPFFTTKGVGKGTGLGLATALAVTQAHGGSLDATSEWGSGSCFTLRLPRALDPVPKRDTGELQPYPSLRGLEVLVVDDEEALRSGMGEVLESCRARVRQAADGEEAWGLWQQAPADLVVTDQLMPRCTGTELLARLRGAGSQVPVLILSGRGLEGLEAELERDPQFAHLPKPFTIARLLRTVAELMKKKPA